jgi:hypothetical protein
MGVAEVEEAAGRTTTAATRATPAGEAHVVAVDRAEERVAALRPARALSVVTGRSCDAVNLPDRSCAASSTR